MARLITGKVIAAHGRHFMVKDQASGQVLHCYPKGKKAGATVGDVVDVTPAGDNQAVINNIHTRRNLLYRSDINKSKQFAANIDQILFVIAVEPEFSTDLLGRTLIAANNAAVDITILLNKSDLPGLDKAYNKLSDMQNLGIKILALSAIDAANTVALLSPILHNKNTLLLGQSGMGKSTILNVLIPNANAATNEYSSALGAGKHTTTHTRLYDLPAGGELIDSPGFQAFGLHHLSDEEVQLGFPEFEPFITQCRFYNCKHLKEPNCGVTTAVGNGLIPTSRYDLYQRVIKENQANKRY